MNAGKKPRALIAMSGGVDSTVAAFLTKRMGFDCEGVTMKLCADTAEGERAADSLDIPHSVVDFSYEFRRLVIDPFVRSYEAGETPNPCIACNSHIKFGLLLEYALKEGFDKLVTGHYARIVEDWNGTYSLARAADAVKDQSYFLYGIGREKLPRILFPLGGLTKGEVREIAQEAGLPAAKSRDSQDICFIPGGGYADYVANYRGTPLAGGNFVDTEGIVLGRHGGIERYTVGQRKGLGIALGRAVFVKEIRPETGEVVLADETEIFSPRIEIADVNWLTDKAENNEVMSQVKTGNIRAQIMIRYNGKPSWAAVSLSENGLLSAEFDEPVRAPAKGQAAVLYDGNKVICGGIIVKRS